jgi:hypothetical protein
MGIHIIRLVSFWCKTIDESLFHKLPLLLPQYVQNLHMQVESQEIGMDQVVMESVPDLIFGVENELFYLH